MRAWTATSEGVDGIGTQIEGLAESFQGIAENASAASETVSAGVSAASDPPPTSTPSSNTLNS